MTGHFAPKAIFGDLLEGKNAVRFIFMDEAGTSPSPQEKVRIVISLVVHGDQQLLSAEAMLREALGAVPTDFAEGFDFHADDVWSAVKYRERWALTDRKNLLQSVMSIPRRLNIPVCMGLCWADTKPSEISETLRLSAPQENHWWAFFHSIAAADRWIRRFAKHDEIATLVAEHNDIKKKLAVALQILRDKGLTLPPGMLAPTEAEKRIGYIRQDGNMRVARVRKAIHWVGKDEDPLVWLADACAFGLKRYFAELSFGEDFCRSIVGGLPLMSDFRGGPCLGQTFGGLPGGAIGIETV